MPSPSVAPAKRGGSAGSRRLFRRFLTRSPSCLQSSPGRSHGPAATASAGSDDRAAPGPLMSCTRSAATPRSRRPARASVTPSRRRHRAWPGRRQQPGARAPSDVHLQRSDSRSSLRRCPGLADPSSSATSRRTTLGSLCSATLRRADRRERTRRERARRRHAAAGLESSTAAADRLVARTSARPRSSAEHRAEDACCRIASRCGSNEYGCDSVLGQRGSPPFNSSHVDLVALPALRSCGRARTALISADAPAIAADASLGRRRRATAVWPPRRPVAVAGARGRTARPGRVRFPDRQYGRRRRRRSTARQRPLRALLAASRGRPPSRTRRRSSQPRPATRELVLGVADALLDLPAVGARLAALDRLELRLRRLELRAGAHVVDLRRIDRGVDERDRAVVLAPGRTRARWRTRARRRRRRDGCASSRPSASRSAARAARARRSRRSARARSASRPRPRTRRRRASPARPRTSACRCRPLLRRLRGGQSACRALDAPLDRADHVEGLLGQVVVLALDDLAGSRGSCPRASRTGPACR